MEIKEQNMPLVSIIATCYNQARFVEESLDSIKNQTYSNIEIIITDDCSTDNSVEIIENWIKKNNHLNCYFIKNEKNIGVSNTLNKALKVISGKYLQLLALDDVILPQKIENQVMIFESLDESYALVYGDMMSIDEIGNTIVDDSYFKASFSCYSGNIFHEIIKVFFFYNQTALIKIEAIKKIGFQFDKHYISEDWLFQLRLSKYFKMYGTKDIVTKYRIVQTSITRQNWTEEKKFYNVVMPSYFTMFYFILRYEKRNTQSWILIWNNLQNYLTSLVASHSLSRIKLIRFSVLLFCKSRTIADFMMCLSIIIYGDLCLYQSYIKFKNSILHKKAI
ncbi:hypothetical protein AGMMS50262_05450 [Bacteroidia bacterium]|nr:hypothetical protein AGMMS50262_05450 [Bacteroidia bacterium]